MDHVLDIPIPASAIDPCNFKLGDILIFQKLYGAKTLDWLQMLASSSVTTLYVDCNMPLKLEEASCVSAVVCSSAHLALAYRQANVEHIFYIPDAAERFSAPVLRPADRKRRCVWFGWWTETRKHELDHIRALIAQFDNLELVVISNHPEADIQWNLETVFDLIHDCDFAVIPSFNYEDPSEKSRSPNRATQTMALGLPVIASPTPAYQDVIQDGWNGYLCVTDDEWTQAVARLLDESHRFQLAQNAYQLSQQFFSIQSVAGLWEDIFQRISEAHQPTTGTLLSCLQDKIRIRKLKAQMFDGLFHCTPKNENKFSYVGLSIRTWPFHLAPYKLLIRLVSGHQ